MRTNRLIGMVFGVALCGQTMMLVASEVEDLRDKAKVVRKEAAVLAEQGNKLEAAHLEAEAAKLIAMAEKLESAQKSSQEISDSNVAEAQEKLKYRLQDLVARELKLRDANADKRELGHVKQQIAAIQEKLAALHGEHPKKLGLRPELQEHDEKLEMAMRRIHHYRAAAENLKMAEAHDLAQQLMEKANAMEKEVHVAREKFAAETQKKLGVAEAMPDVIHELRAEIASLRAELKELQARLDK